MSDATFLLEVGYWVTRPLALLIGVLLITMPYFTRVRVHARMSDEAFANVHRGALWAQTLGLGVLVILGELRLELAPQAVLLEFQTRRLTSRVVRFFRREPSPQRGGVARDGGVQNAFQNPFGVRFDSLRLEREVRPDQNLAF